MIRRNQGGEPLGAARVIGLGLRLGQTGIGPPRELGNPVGIEFAEGVPR